MSDVRYPGELRQEETVLKQCSSATPDATELPCWRLEEDMMGCADTDSHLSLVVERGNGSVPTGTHTQLRCVTL